MPEFTMEGLTEEQLKLVQGEIDRRVTDAVKTTTTKVTKQVTEELTSAFDEKLNLAVAEAQGKSAATDEEKISALTEQINELRRMNERNSLERLTEQRLRDAGLGKESVDALLPMIVNGNTPETIEESLNVFVNTRQNDIKRALDEQQQKLALGMTPPPNPSGASYKQDPKAAINEIMNREGVDPHYATAEAAQYLINNWGQGQ